MHVFCKTVKENYKDTGKYVAKGVQSLGICQM